MGEHRQELIGQPVEPNSWAPHSTGYPALQSKVKSDSQGRHQLCLLTSACMYIHTYNTCTHNTHICIHAHVCPGTHTHTPNFIKRKERRNRNVYLREDIRKENWSETYQHGKQSREVCTWHAYKAVLVGTTPSKLTCEEGAPNHVNVPIRLKKENAECFNVSCLQSWTVVVLRCL